MKTYIEERKYLLTKLENKTINWVDYKNMSETFIIGFKDEIDWRMVSIHSKLSEETIREFHYLVYWEMISCYQKICKSY